MAGSEPSSEWFHVKRSVKAPVKEPKERGRPSAYSPEIATALCTRLINGQSLRSVCRDLSMPSISTVYEWLFVHPQFSEQYTRAKEDQADTYADEIIDIADNSSADLIPGEDGKMRVDHEAINRSRLRVDARKWVASKLKAKKYGERVEQLHVGDKDRPIVLSPIDADL
jgi:hypothetical protein